MLKRLVILLALCIAAVGCDADYGEGFYPFEAVTLSDEGRQSLERDKRELLKIEEIEVGHGPVAAWEGQRLTADIEVRYADGGLIYQGPIRTYVGFHIALYNGLTDPNLLPISQPGIELGLNGMAVGGRRRITIDRKLVCLGLREDADPRARCHLLRRERHFVNEVNVRKKALIVEATLIESCTPVVFRAIKLGGEYVILKQVRCRDSETPKLDPTLPVWHIY